MISVFTSVESIVGKGENAVYHYFLLLLQCFERALFVRVIKTQDTIALFQTMIHNPLSCQEILVVW